MPTPGKRWRHVVISTHNSWLPGDPRGFRTYRHKRHSSGDYKHRPPAGEHAGLYHYSRGISGEPVVVPVASRPVIGRAMLEELARLEHQALVIAVAGMHVHALVELPDDPEVIRAILGRCKQRASHAVRDVLPGRVWARDGSCAPVDSRAHHRRVFRYIWDQPGAWAWSFRCGQRWNA